MGSAGGNDKVPAIIDRVRMDALQLVTMSALPGALAALARLNIFEGLAKAGDGAQLTAAEIAERALPGKSINLSYLGRLLHMVAGKKILREVVTTTGNDDGVGPVERRYALEPITRFLVDDAENGSFVHGLLLTYQNPGAFLQTFSTIQSSRSPERMA